MAGAPDAPDLTETVQNFAINSGALALLVFLLLRDRQKANQQLKTIEREEVLAKLEVSPTPSHNHWSQTLPLCPKILCPIARHFNHFALLTRML